MKKFEQLEKKNQSKIKISYIHAEIYKEIDRRAFFLKIPELWLFPFFVSCKCAWFAPVFFFLLRICALRKFPEIPITNIS